MDPSTDIGDLQHVAPVDLGALVRLYQAQQAQQGAAPGSVLAQPPTWHYPEGTFLPETTPPPSPPQPPASMFRNQAEFERVPPPDIAGAAHQALSLALPYIIRQAATPPGEVNPENLNALTQFPSRALAILAQGNKVPGGATSTEAPTLGDVAGMAAAARGYGKAAQFGLRLGVDVALDPINWVMPTLGSAPERAIGLAGLGVNRKILGGAVSRAMEEGVGSVAPEVADAARRMSDYIVKGGGEGLSLTDIRHGVGLDRLQADIAQRLEEAHPGADPEALQKAAAAGLGNVQRALRPATVRSWGMNPASIAGEHTNEPFEPWAQSVARREIDKRMDTINLRAAQAAAKRITGRPDTPEDARVAGQVMPTEQEVIDRENSLKGIAASYWQAVRDGDEEKAAYYLDHYHQVNSLPARSAEERHLQEAHEKFFDEQDIAAKALGKPAWTRMGQAFERLSGVNPAVRAALEAGYERGTTQFHDWERRATGLMKGMSQAEQDAVADVVQFQHGSLDETVVVPPKVAASGMLLRTPIYKDAAGIQQELMGRGIPEARAKELATGVVPKLRSLMDESWMVKTNLRGRLGMPETPNPAGYMHADWQQRLLNDIVEGYENNEALSGPRLGTSVQMTPKYAELFRGDLDAGIREARAAGDEARVAQLEELRGETPNYARPSMINFQGVVNSARKAFNLSNLLDVTEKYGIPYSREAELAGWRRIPYFEGTPFEDYMLPAEAIAPMQTQPQSVLGRNWSALMRIPAAQGLMGVYHPRRVLSMLPVRNWLLGGQNPAEFAKWAGRGAMVNPSTGGLLEKLGFNRDLSPEEQLFGNYVRTAAQDTSQDIMPSRWGEQETPIEWASRWLTSPMTKLVRPVTSAAEGAGAATLWSQMVTPIEKGGLGYSPATAYEMMRKAYPSFESNLLGPAYQALRSAILYPTFYGEVGKRAVEAATKNPALLRVPGHVWDAYQEAIPPEQRIDVSSLNPGRAIMYHQVLPEDADARAVAQSALSRLPQGMQEKLRTGDQEILPKGVARAEDIAAYNEWLRNPALSAQQALDAARQRNPALPKSLAPQSELKQAMLATFIHTGDTRYFPRYDWGVTQRSDNKFLHIAERAAAASNLEAPIGMAQNWVRDLAMLAGAKPDFGFNLHSQSVGNVAKPVMNDDGTQLANKAGHLQFHQDQGMTPTDFERSFYHEYEDTIGKPPPGFFWAPTLTHHNGKTAQERVLMISPGARKLSVMMQMMMVPSSAKDMATAAGVGVPYAPTDDEKAAALDRWWGGDTYNVVPRVAR